MIITKKGEFMKTMLSLITIFFLIALIIHSSDAQTVLYVKEKEGSQNAFPLPDIRKITFDGPGLVVTRINSDLQIYPISTLRFLSFKNYFEGIANPEPASSNILRIWPNPVSTELHIEWIGNQDAVCRLQILDSEGRVIIQDTFRKGKAVLNILQLKTGIYYCRVQNNSEIITGKFIKK
jgi:hypothetical protein